MPDVKEPEEEMLTCDSCGNEQPDMGRNVACEECGERMPEAKPKPKGKPDA